VEWGLGFWFSQFNAVLGFSPAHIQQMHDALRCGAAAGLVRRQGLLPREQQQQQH
jgi:hypothetical protein